MRAKLTVWALTALKKIKQAEDAPILERQTAYGNFEVILLEDTLWVVGRWGNNATSAFRTAYSPYGLTITNKKVEGNTAVFDLLSDVGEFEVSINFPDTASPLLHYAVSFKADEPLTIPYWPKDVLAFSETGKSDSEGELYIKQIGIRTGMIYAGYGGDAKGSFLYFQNLTAINDYFTATETSAADTVGGEWPEWGFSLPPTKEKLFPAGRQMVIADAYVCFNETSPANQFEIAIGFMDGLANIYRVLPKPETVYRDYKSAIKSSIHDIEHNKGCWSLHKGCSYLNAYVCDYATPPEIMVQLAVLLPVWDYQDWSGEQLVFANQIYDNIQTFWNEELHTIKRWLPAVEDQLDGSEEQKVPDTMDAWYLHHPLLNLARMALAGDEMAKDLFLKSIDYAIKVAHHFNYKWPVFYNMRTLETIKAETKPGAGGEKDVAGVYVQIMLQAWDLTGNRKFYEEAETAAQSLKQFGFDVFYQANNVAFATKATLRLYKETGKQIYLDICNMLIANMFKNMAIWECDYGYGKNFPLFFGLFPLNDAPYMAVYEEQECFAAFQDLLVMAEQAPLSESAKLLLAEYVKYFINRAIFYYPPMLPNEMLAEEPTTGEIDPKLWIALEDIHDGWEKSGSVGQEVYGAGLAFGIVPRHYIIIPGQPFMVFIDYPTSGKVIKDNTLSITVLGNGQFTCRLCVIKTEDKDMPDISVLAGNKHDQELLDKMDMRQMPLEVNVHGDQTIIIRWAN